MVVIEGMACGRAVVAHDIPGVRSVISDGEDGLLVRPGDPRDLAAAMGGLLRDPQRRRVMGERGRAKVEERYDWSRIIQRLEDVYQAALASGRSAH